MIKILEYFSKNEASTCLYNNDGEYSVITSIKIAERKPLQAFDVFDNLVEALEFFNKIVISNEEYWRDREVQYY